MFKILKKGIAKTVQRYSRRRSRSRLRAKVLEDTGHLREVKINELAITVAKRLLVCSLGPETSGLVTFLRHYRNLGVNHFLLVDGSDSTQVAVFLAEQDDCSVWKPMIDFKQAEYGTRFYNALLHKYCIGKWTLCVDLDELFVFPYMETRTLQDLITQLEDCDRKTLWALSVEVYGPGPMAQTDRESPDLRYFDPSGYYQTYGNRGQIQVRGGPRTRLLDDPVREKLQSASSVQKVPEMPAGSQNVPEFDRSPFLQKLPLIKPDGIMIYEMRQRNVFEEKLNWPHKWHQCPTGVLLTYKYHRQYCESLIAGRTLNSAGPNSALFTRLLRDQLKKNPEFGFYMDWSVPFESSLSLLDYGLMADGTALRPASRFAMR